jgi:hypothetical protein
MSTTTNAHNAMNTEHTIAQGLTSGRFGSFHYLYPDGFGLRVNCQRGPGGFLLTLPDGRTAITPGIEGMVEFRGSVSYLLKNPKVKSVAFDREGNANVTEGSENYQLLKIA